jgi:hypothetical protein
MSKDHFAIKHINFEVTGGASPFDNTLAAPGPGLAWHILWLQAVADGGGTGTFLTLETFATGAAPADGKYKSNSPIVAAGVRNQVELKPSLGEEGMVFSENLGVTLRLTFDGTQPGGQFVQGAARVVPMIGQQRAT